MLIPSMEIYPSSTGQTPAIAFKVVDLPAPLPPITVTKSPSFKVRLTPSSATFSLMVPGLNVLCTFLISNIFGTSNLTAFSSLFERRFASSL